MKRLFQLVMFLACAGMIPSFALDNRFDEVWYHYLFKTQLPANAVIVAAGAHTEDGFRGFAQHWTGGKVIVFEPNPELFAAVESASRAFGNTQVLPYALDATTHVAPFYITYQIRNRRIGSLLPSKEAHRWYYRDDRVIETQCVNLEEWAAVQNIDHVDLLWLNLGGNEFRVLQSIPNLLHTVQIIYVETYFQEFREGNGLFSDLEEYLNGFGFMVHKHVFNPDYQGAAVFIKKLKEIDS